METMNNYINAGDNSHVYNNVVGGDQFVFNIFPNPIHVPDSSVSGTKRTSSCANLPIPSPKKIKITDFFANETKAGVDE
jgi:hypothetical protein